MAKSETLPVQKDAEKLCKHTLIITNNLDNFPTKYRFTLVDRVLRISFDIQSWKNHAMYCTDHSIFRYYENKLSELRRHRNGY